MLEHHIQITHCIGHSSHVNTSIYLLMVVIETWWNLISMQERLNATLLAENCMITNDSRNGSVIINI
jgi:hypothetical protein